MTLRHTIRHAGQATVIRPRSGHAKRAAHACVLPYRGHQMMHILTLFLCFKFQIYYYLFLARCWLINTVKLERASQEDAMVPFICIAVVVLGLRVVAADEGMKQYHLNVCICHSLYRVRSQYK